MKKLTVLLATLFVFFTADAQQILAGIYSGSMYNDSTKMLQKYELALSEYRGKVFGYSYVTFVVNDTFYYGIRRVKGYKNDKNELVLTDEELLANNFPESPAKRVKRTATFPLAQEDTITNLSGTWQTNRTRQYYSVGGATKTERSVDSAQSPLVAHLKELKIIADQPTYQEAVVAKAKPKKEEKKNEVAKNTPEKPADAGRKSDTEAIVAANNKPVPVTNKTTTTKTTTADPATTGTNGSTEAPVNKSEEKKAAPPANPVAQKPVVIDDRTGDVVTEKEKPGTNNRTETAKNPAANKPAESGNNSVAEVKKQPAQPQQDGITQEKPGVKPTDVAKEEAAKKTGLTTKSTGSATEAVKDNPSSTGVAANNPAAHNNNTAGAENKTATAQPGTSGTTGAGEKANTPADKPAAVAASAPLAERSTNVIQTLEVLSDSITLSFYDNGVVDGDVISVFVNGQNIIASAKLTEVAMKKTIQLPTFAGDSVQVTLVAETLGSIPPNTGLLLVYDGDKRYDVRFAADMQTNASIVFRKAKK